MRNVQNFYFARGFAEVLDGGCRYESQNAMGNGGLFCPVDVGVWMRRSGNDAATPD